MSNPEEKIQEAAENIKDAVSSAKAAVENVKDAIDEQKLSEQRQIRRGGGGSHPAQTGQRLGKQKLT